MALLARVTAPLPVGEGGQRDAVVELYPVADDTGLPDDDAGTVVDEEAASDPGARIDVDAGRAVRILRTTLTSLSNGASNGVIGLTFASKVSA